MITETARAKVNLTLEIHGRRPDGYHELVSLVVFPDVGDTVTLEPDAPFAVTMDGPFASAIEGENLIEKACWLAGQSQPGFRIGAIRLTKRLPVAAGVGGGSADAAAALRARVRAGLALAPGTLHEIATHLGADVTVCLEQRTSMMWGVGERVAHVPALPPFWVVLVNPGVPLATADVFRALRAPPLSSPPRPPEVTNVFGSLDTLVAWLRARRNDLQAPAIALCPAIADVLTALQGAPGCLFAAQSGSGPTCFGIFADETGARDAAALMAATQAGWWIAHAAVDRAAASR